MSREAKFNFIPENQLGNHVDEGLKVSFSPKTSMLKFSNKSPETAGLTGKFVKFYIDTAKNTLAWKWLTKETCFENLEAYSQVKETNYGGTKAVQIYVPKKVIGALKLKEGASYSSMLVKRYVETGLLTEEQYHYVSMNLKDE